MNRTDQQDLLAAKITLPGAVLTKKRDHSTFPDFLEITFPNSRIEIRLRVLYQDCVEISFVANGYMLAIRQISGILETIKSVNGYDLTTGNFWLQATRHDRDRIVAGVVDLMMKEATNTLVSWVDYDKVQLIQYHKQNREIWVVRGRETEIILSYSNKSRKLDIQDPKLVTICTELMHENIEGLAEV